MAVKETILVEYSKDCSIINRTQLRESLASQVFTPCGRYGISLPIDYGIRETQSSSLTLPVIDFFHRKLSHYRYELNAHNQWDIIYCLDSITLVSIRAKCDGFVQKVWRLNHKEETVSILSTRNYRHNIESHELMIIHLECKKDLAVDFQGDAFNVWISAGQHSGHHLLFLIPRNPYSTESLKLFYVDLNTFPTVVNDVLYHYNLNQDGSPYIAPFVMRSSLWFPASVKEKQIFGVWVAVDLEDLENLIVSEHVEIEVLKEMQKPAYKVFALERHGTQDIDDQYPSLEANFNTGPTHAILWEKYRSGLTVPRIMITNLSNGMIHITTQELFNYETICMHPCGGLLVWSLTRNGLLAVRIYKEYENTVRSLFKMTQKKLFWEKSAKFKSITGYDRIMFN